MKIKSNSHRAEIIEVYASEGRMAVRFRNNGKDRIECVAYPTIITHDSPTVSAGKKGWVSFDRILGGYGWSFSFQRGDL